MENNKPTITFFEKDNLQNSPIEIKSASNKIEQCVLAILYFLTFVFVNSTIYFVIFKTSWPMPRIFNLLLLNYPLSFLNGENIIKGILNFLVFYLYPSLSLSRSILNKFYNVVNSSKVLTKWTVRPKVIIFILLFIAVLIGGYATFGLLLWVIPATIIVVLEYWLLYKLSIKILNFAKSVNTFSLEFAIVPIILMIFYAFAYFSSPIRQCKDGGYQCIAVAAVKTNNLKLCEKVASPYSSTDCFRFIAAANNNSCFCELSIDEMQKMFCYESFEGNIREYRDFIGKWYSRELNEAIFKDNSMINNLNCNKSLEFKKETNKNKVIEHSSAWGLSLIVKDWYKKNDTFSGVWEDSYNQEKIKMVVDKIKKETGVDIEYYVKTTDKGFVVKTKNTNNTLNFQCIDRFSGKVKYDVEINRDNFSADTNCYGDPLSSYIAPETRKEGQTFEDWYKTDIKNASPSYFE